MAGKRKDIIRIGDRVEILNPMVVDRVGYPKQVKDYRPKPNCPKTGEVWRKVKELERFIGLKPRGFLDDPILDDPTLFENQILDVVQYHMAKVDGFGGRKRSVHTTERPILAGKEATVIARRVVQTGWYYGASRYSDDYEPGGLTDRVPVVLLGLRVDSWGELRRILSDGVEWWIQASNLRKIEVENDRKRVA